MQLFHRIDDAQAVVRQKGGVYKQVEVYHRGERVYIKTGGGFVRLEPKFGDFWGTSSPSINVVDISQDVPGLFVNNEGRVAPYWKAKK